MVSGVYCAACIQKIETTLLNSSGIKTARLNFSTRRLNFSWRGNPERANDFVREVEALGYSVQPYSHDIGVEDTRKEERFLLLCLGVAGFAMGNVMLLSVGVWSTSEETMGIATRDFMHWLSALIALPTILFSGRPFFRSALKALSVGQTNMNVPISLALVLASAMSLFETANHGAHVYFDSAVMLLFFLLVGRYMDFRARKNARSTATNLLSALSGFANVIKGDKIQRILIQDLVEGALVRVNIGEKFPADGIIYDGVSDVDTSLVTGETLTRPVVKGDDVFAGTINMSAPITMRVIKAAESSLLADIVRLMEQAGQGQAAYVRLADKVARLYTPVVHIFAVVAFIGWWVFGDLAWQPSLMIAITVLIITCPCALGLAVPVVQVLASGRLLRRGVIVKSGDALERLARIDKVFLDKTGTLTLGRPMLEGDYDLRLLRIAASLASHSAHPLSRAMTEFYEGALLPVKNIKEHAGKGVQGNIDGVLVKIGRRSWCGDKNAPASDKLEFWIQITGEKPFAFHFTGHLREHARSTIESFKTQNIQPMILSGDRSAPVAGIAKQCGIELYESALTPRDKFEFIQRAQVEGHNVLMVGDGLNDAPVLAAADISIAPGAAIDLVQNAADIVFMGEQFSAVYEAYNVARMTQKLVRQNFILAIAYNTIAVPLALFGFVTPFIAAVAMSGSSLVVIANSFRLKWMK